MLSKLFQKLQLKTCNATKNGNFLVMLQDKLEGYKFSNFQPTGTNNALSYQMESFLTVKDSDFFIGNS